MTRDRPLVFDIKRHSLDDGPGIRTTVFLKGCNLRCLWCHNPESNDRNHEIGFYPNRCIQCGDCVSVCQVQACRLEDAVHIDREKCVKCGSCVKVCPADALRTIGHFYPVEELVEILLRDKAFYEVSDGGVTLSGGEPTLHMDYCREVLYKLKEWRIHTTLQTNGLFDWEEFQEKILPRVDLILFDVKLADARNHLEYTCEDNLHIQANLARLVQVKPSSVLPRIPLIPEFTATQENLQALSVWFQEIGVRQCSLLPYNPTWAHKAESLGRKMNSRLSTKMLMQTELERWRNLFKRYDLVDFNI
jgi:pyruvate formate lyase activating enzyme